MVVTSQPAQLCSCINRHPHDMPLLIITGHPVMQPPTIHSPTHSSIRPKRKRLGVDDLIGPGKPQCGVGRWMRAVVEHGPQAFSVRDRRGHGQHTCAVHYNYTAHTHARTHAHHPQRCIVPFCCYQPARPAFPSTWHLVRLDY